MGDGVAGVQQRRRPLAINADVHMPTIVTVGVWYRSSVAGCVRKSCSTNGMVFTKCSVTGLHCGWSVCAWIVETVMTGTVHHSEAADLLLQLRPAVHPMILSNLAPSSPSLLSSHSEIHLHQQYLTVLYTEGSLVMIERKSSEEMMCATNFELAAEKPMEAVEHFVAAGGMSHTNDLM